MREVKDGIKSNGGGRLLQTSPVNLLNDNDQIK